MVRKLAGGYALETVSRYRVCFGRGTTHEPLAYVLRPCFVGHLWRHGRAHPPT